MRLIDIDKFLSENYPKISNDYDGLGCPEDGYTPSQLKNAPTANAVLIPENATNGDMIRALFADNFIIVEFLKDTRGSIDHVTLRHGSDILVQFDGEWWNAPYGKESK